MASKGGSPASPDWYFNLTANPDVTVQIKGEKFPPTPAPRRRRREPAMWDHMVEVWPDYADYPKKTDRTIPIVVLERT